MMASHAAELLLASEVLISRDAGQRGRLSQARIRRSISTSYYALFSFLIEQATDRLVGTKNDLRRRRRVLARCFDHGGIKSALVKVKDAQVDASVVALLSGGGAVAPMPSPPFARDMARAFCDAQAKRHDADYNMNELLSEVDARLLLARVRNAIEGWRLANTAAERDFKHALYLLLLLGGKVRNA